MGLQLWHSSYGTQSAVLIEKSLLALEILHAHAKGLEPRILLPGT